MHLKQVNKMWQCLVFTFVFIVSFIGCMPKNQGEVRGKETADSIHIGKCAFAMDSDSIVQLRNVQWRVDDARDGVFILLTSTPIDSPEIMSVVQLIDSICGKHDEVEYKHFVWDGLKLRRLYSERVVGSIMIINKRYEVITP